LSKQPAEKNLPKTTFRENGRLLGTLRLRHQTYKFLRIVAQVKMSDFM
jgi:hypothetical protein